MKWDGRSSFIDKLSDAEYNNLPVLRSTDLKEFLKSPAHYRFSKDNREDNAAFAMGRFVHALVLEPETISANFSFVDVKSRNAIEYKKANEAAIKSGKTVILNIEREAAERMAENAMNDPNIADLLEGGYSEIASVAKLGSVWCSAKADNYNPEKRYILDLKSTSESAFWFSSVVRRYSYDISAAFYLDVFNAAALDLGQTDSQGADTFILVAMEKKPPYLSRVFVFDDAYIAYARTRYQEALPRFKQCLDTNTWTGYSNATFERLSLPNGLSSSGTDFSDNSGMGE